MPTNKLSPAKQALLEQRLRKAASGGAANRAIPRRPERDSAPLSFMQRQMWVIDQMTPGNAAYNMPYGYRLRGPVDVGALQRGFNEIIKRHDVLRTTFAVRDGEPVQVVHPELTITIRVTPLDRLPAPERENRLHALASEESLRPFDLSRLPLIRVSLFKLSDTDHCLIVNLHHIVADGMSIAPLFDELDTFYRAFTEGAEPRPPELAVQYGDFAAWQRHTAAGRADAGAQLDFWRARLGGRLPVLELPGDRPRPATQSFAGGNVFFDIPAGLAQELKALGEREGCTFFMTMLAAFQVLLLRHSGADDMIIGTPVSVRTASELAPLIGLFLNMVPLRCDLSGDPTFIALLKQTRDIALDAFSHGDLPLESLMQDLKVERDPSRNPVFQVALQVMSSSLPRIGSLEVSSFHFDLKFAQFDLTLHLYQEEGINRGRFEYCSDLFEAETVCRLRDHFLAILAAVVRDPRQRVATIPMLSAAERRQLLTDWNSTAAAGPVEPSCLHQWFEAQARRTPHRVAVVFERQALTYEDLNRRANRLAHRLRGMGVGPDVPVALFVERSLDMLVGMVAILKAGGAYVPMDPAYPEERLRFIIEDSHAPIVLTQEALVKGLATFAVQPVCLDADAASMAGESQENPQPSVTPDNLAYVLFTSGSTGRPKGVALEHRSATALVQWARSVFTPDELAAVLCGTSVCFDLSVFEIFVTLSAGGRIVLARDVLDLPNLPARNEVTLINTVPSAMAELLRMRAVPPAVQVVNLAGEALPDVLVEQLYATTGVRKVYNLYGPTETTTYSTYTLVPRGRPVTIGKPIAGTQCYILDAQRNPVPVGVLGELYLAGHGLARGYYGRPDLTAERFVPHPFSERPGARMYRTGDLCRWLPDGTIQYAGRLDHQVKLRGFRIELGEIETALLRDPAVHDAVVVARADPPGDQRLVAYVVAEHRGPDVADELRARLHAILPAYMMPAAFVLLDALPHTPNGKVDRGRLPAPEHSDAPRGDHVAPRTLTEEILADAWADILDLERVGVEDNFFELGGHSLLATRVVSRVRQSLAVELPLREIFAAPTVARLAARIETLRGAGVGGAAPPPPPPPLEGGSETGPAELSFSQQRLWFLDQLEPGLTTYVMPGAIEMQGVLDVPVLERALVALTGRHESLRTRIVMQHGQPLQTVAEPRTWTLPLVDLAQEGEPRERLKVVLLQEASRAFDLTGGPLFRARLYRLAHDRHVLLLTMHHIVSDGWSLGILFRELGELYDRFSRGESAALPPLSVQYRAYARWQRRWLQGQALDDLLAYWRSHLAGAPHVLELPADRPRPAAESHRGATVAFSLPRDLLEALRGLARREGATLYMTLLTGFTALLSRYTGQEDFLLGTPVANRGRAEIEDVIGCFINTLVLRADVSGDPPVRELLRRTRDECLEAFAHQDLPFERLVSEMHAARDVSRNPVVQVLFALQNAPQRPLELPGLTLSPLDIDRGVAQLDLTLQVHETAAGLSGSFEYATDLFDESTIRRMSAHWRALLQAMVATPERRVSELPLLTQDERRQLTVEWNRTARASQPHATVHALFQAQAERTPGAVALTLGDRRLTYREVDHHSNQLAHQLRARGAGPGERVGLCVERSLDMVVALLGILKTGAAYVPLDPAFPAERLRFMADDARLALIVSTADLATIFDLPRGRQLLLDADAEAIASAPRSALPATDQTTQPAEPAYIIYTSGSTGKPKGVVVPHRAVVNFLTSMAREPGMAAGEVLVAVTTVSFDIAVLELLLPLTLGARVALATHGETGDGRALRLLLDRHHATVMQATPVTWRLLLEAGWSPQRGFKALIGGEALPRDLADQLLACGVELWNMYGPTETTVWSTCARITDTSNGITIGKPIANTVVRVLDPRRNLCPVGVPGELCIGGAGVALGYWDRPGLTADKFIPDPHDGAATLYCTGDRARWRADGTLEHLGRLDDQVKVRGFRIEVGEVEAAIARHPAIREVAVVARDYPRGDKQLIAYLVVAHPEADIVGQVRSLIRTVLPEYMVPTRFTVVPALPRTANGKLDRQALPAPEIQDAPSDGAVAPRSPTETTVLRVFREVLGRDDFGVFGNFFDLGGDSLMAARMVLRLRAATGCDAPLRLLFERQTAAALAEAIDAIAWMEHVADQPDAAGERVEIEL